MAPFPQTTLPAHQRPGRGRPSEYKPEYCEAVQDYMAQGYSLTAFAGNIRKSRQAVYEWINQHSEFGDAVSRARSARVAALETKLLRSRKGAETSAAIFALRNADPMEWRDIRQVQHDHSHTVATLTDAQLFAIASGNPSGSGDVIEGQYEDVTATR